jgi:hypothetical protein
MEHKKRRRIALIFRLDRISQWNRADLPGNGEQLGSLGTLLGVLLTLGSVIGGLIFARIVHAKKIDKSYVRLKGCGIAFLDSLPPFSGQPRLD